jgi:hypothetical protein
LVSTAPYSTLVSEEVCLTDWIQLNKPNYIFELEKKQNQAAMQEGGWEVIRVTYLEQGKEVTLFWLCEGK